ncbi:uncharacterized protein LTHEOB_4211 [Neofusicoccum parvum]|uniref:Uncharacterized protein LTHEOB_4211 n=1 Tax=Neofusicoccum parvum TaxID=310453 RepID=A0ACB5SQF8_9PEZI|nr:uncharacterized protein LTHEOB_4211 [Neofusicoccum parvum]
MQIHEVILTASMELAKPESPAGLGGDIWSSLQPILLASFVCVVACSIGLAFITYYLHQVFAWAIYKLISADVDVRRRHLQYHLYLVTAKLCLFSSVGFLFIYGFVELRPEQPEFAVTMLLVPVAVLKPILAVYFIKHEVTSGAMTITALYIAQTAYLLSRVVIVAGKSEQSAADNAIIFFATAALFCTILTLDTVIQCLRNFDHGLKPFLLARQDQGEGQRTGTSWELSQSELHLVRRFSMD